MDRDNILVVVLGLLGLLLSQVSGELNARYHVVPGQVGSLCRTWNRDTCRKKIPVVPVHSAVECAIFCAKHPRCESFNYQLSPSPRKLHRCEMATEKQLHLETRIRKGTGFEYYKNIT